MTFFIKQAILMTNYLLDIAHYSAHISLPLTIKAEILIIIKNHKLPQTAFLITYSVIVSVSLYVL